jgi:Anti-sigma-K factor rskA
MNRGDRPDDHQRFQEMAALAQGKELSDREEMDLARHLQQCAVCRKIYHEYSVLSTEGMAYLAVAGGHVPESETWHDRPTRSRLLSRIREVQPLDSGRVVAMAPNPVKPFSAWVARRRGAAMAAAACLIFVVGAGAFHLGSRILGSRILDSRLHGSAVQSSSPIGAAQLQQLAAEKKTADDLFASQSEHILELQKQIAGNQHDLVALHTELKSAEDRAAQLSAASTKEQTQLRQVSAERDTLADQVREAEKAYQLLQAEFTNLKAEHDRALVHTASLESKIEDLSSTSHDQERKLKDDEQYLSSDRDIRELMGARKLYIADVFDVDSGSRTRKAFGRVFYTQNKSLIFYAFDLDRQPGVKNASAFQVWGQRDGELGSNPHPMNLGILYMDSESNRRWVLRWDDPKQLAEIDAVFVTVEPHGGSQKPTGKPFLYALLRKEANHP